MYWQAAIGLENFLGAIAARRSSTNPSHKGFTMVYNSKNSFYL
ncbi:hypothetical protein [Phormidesmis priestleyi]|nr:hypothetical protein [Phormidesmis priestleyi]